MKLLIVDDEKNIRIFMQDFLLQSELPFSEIETAENGGDGLEKARLFRPDLVITDIVMPRLTGHQLIEEIKRSCPDCVFIMISGHDDVKYFKGAIDQHVFQYILKPIQISELLSTLQNAILEVKTRKLQHFDTLLSVFPSELPSADGIAFEEEIDGFLKSSARDLNGKDIQILQKKLASFFMLEVSAKIGSGKLLYEDFRFSQAASLESAAELTEWFHYCIKKLSELQEPSMSGHYKSMTREIAKYVEEHFQKDIGAAEISEHCNISRGYLSAIFNDEFHMTIPQYIAGIRLQHSLHLLRESFRTVSDIALDCGFNDVNYFIKVFKNNFGLSPGQYRNGEVNRHE